MVKILRDFVHGLSTDERVDANMWLSVYDCAQRAQDQDLSALAKARFEALFDWDSLSTEGEKQAQTAGRKVKRQN